MMMNPRRSLRLAGSSEDPAGNKDRHKEQGTNKQWGEQEELRNKLLQGSVVSFFVFYLLLQGFFVPHSPLEQGTTYTNKEHKQGTQTRNTNRETQTRHTKNTNKEHKQPTQTRSTNKAQLLQSTTNTNKEHKHYSHKANRAQTRYKAHKHYSHKQARTTLTRQN